MLGQSVKVSLSMLIPNNWLKNRKLLLAIVLFGFLLRIGFVLSQRNEIYWVDGVEYHALAQQIVNGNGYVTTNGTPTAYRPIGYPLFLALLFEVGGTGLLWIRFMQVIISSATILMVYLLAKRVLNPNLAIISAAIVAVYPYFAFLPGAILPTCWFSFLLVIGVYFIVRSREKNRIFEIGLAGIVFGLAILTRPSAAVLGSVVLFWLLVFNYSKPKQALVQAATFGLCVSLVVMPWIYRNYTVMGKATVATNGGRNFWLGNNPEATAISGNNVALPKTLEERLTSAQSELEQERIYYQQGKRFILQHPHRFVRLSIAKAVNFWRLYPILTNSYPHMESLSRWVSALTSAPLLVLGMLGLIMVWRSSKPEAFLLLMFFIAFTILHAIFISKVRMRLPLDHFLAIFASSALVRTLAWIRNVVAAVHHCSRVKNLGQIFEPNKIGMNGVLE